MNWESKLQERVAQVETVIQKFLPEEQGYQKTVLKAMNYSVLAGGKRLRPMLMEETYRLFGGKLMSWIDVPKRLLYTIRPLRLP